MTDSTSIGYGQANPGDWTSDALAISFMVRQIVAEMSTSKLVQVVSVTGGGVSANTGTVIVQPLVQQIDGYGNGTPHGKVGPLPWTRIQGGKNAVICDPQVNDVGYVVAMDRDISTVTSQAPLTSRTTTGYVPNARRRFDIQDGIYVGGSLNVAPNQYLIFTATGVRLVDLNGNSFVMSSTGITWTDLNGNKMITGAGFVNFVTTALQVNGVPVTVP
jgi:uncharacterized spore protein YtfJ